MTGASAAAPRNPGAQDRSHVTPEIAAEAAVWVARLHGPNRTPQVEQEFLVWQASSAAHREAFERCTDVWEDIPRIGLATALRAATSQRTASTVSSRGGGTVRRWIVACAVTGSVTACAALLLHWHGENDYGTNVGEQRLVVLEDGSRMLMNTDTHLRVDFGSAQRTVDVSRGEALFEVTKDPRRPFVVRLAGTEVVAVGTAFSVHYAPTPHAGDELVVTLIEGQVHVRAADGHASDALAPDHPVSMKAGDRYLLDRAPGHASVDAVGRLDRPNVDRVLAWKRNEAIFDDTSLVDAVAEMNRYNRTPIVLLDGLAASDLRVSGLYRTGDSAGFAQAVATLHGLRVHEAAGRLELTKPH
jgi:transmembrane sensor